MKSGRCFHPGYIFKEESRGVAGLLDVGCEGNGSFRELHKAMGRKVVGLGVIAKAHA